MAYYPLIQPYPPHWGLAPETQSLNLLSVQSGTVYSVTLDVQACAGVEAGGGLLYRSAVDVAQMSDVVHVASVYASSVVAVDAAASADVKANIVAAAGASVSQGQFGIAVPSRLLQSVMDVDGLAEADVSINISKTSGFIIDAPAEWAISPSSVMYGAVAVDDVAEVLLRASAVGFSRMYVVQGSQQQLQVQKFVQSQFAAEQGAGLQTGASAYMRASFFAGQGTVLQVVANKFVTSAMYVQQLTIVDVRAVKYVTSGASVLQGLFVAAAANSLRRSGIHVVQGAQSAVAARIVQVDSGVDGLQVGFAYAGAKKTASSRAVVSAVTQGANGFKLIAKSGFNVQATSYIALSVRRAVSLQFSIATVQAGNVPVVVQSVNETSGIWAAVRFAEVSAVVVFEDSTVEVHNSEVGAWLQST